MLFLKVKKFQLRAVQWVDIPEWRGLFQLLSKNAFNILLLLLLLSLFIRHKNTYQIQT